jgi:hypothetical protein
MALSITTKYNTQTGYTTLMNLTAGDTVAQQITFATGGTPINLSGCSLKCQINFPAPLVLNTTNGGIAITNAALGAAQINISSAVTAAIAPGSYAYDLWMVSPTGAETAMLAGLFIVTPNITVVP